MDYTKIREYIISRQLLQEIFEIMRYFGNDNKEVFLLLLGKQSNDKSITILDYIIPKQYPFSDGNGVGVYIDPYDIQDMNRKIFHSSLIPVGQIHSHPNQAYHSNADDKMSMVTAAGQLSIVIPFFGNEELFSFIDIAIYVLNRNGKWKILSENKKNNLFKVENYD